MTQRDIEVLHSRLEEAHRTMEHAKQQLDTIESLARSTNGRVKELELWRAKWQGAASASRVSWLLAGGALTALVIDVMRGIG
jgi:chromosome condensin MukBEF ATPase and DNA-binding subunit MukB